MFEKTSNIEPEVSKEGARNLKTKPNIMTTTSANKLPVSRSLQSGLCDREQPGGSGEVIHLSEPAFPVSRTGGLFQLMSASPGYQHSINL